MNAEHSKRLADLLANQRGCGMPAARELARTLDRIRKRVPERPRIVNTNHSKKSN